MSSRIWTAGDSGSATSTWVGLSHMKERNSPLLFYLKNGDFFFPAPQGASTGTEWNDTEILPAAQRRRQRLRHQLCSSLRQRERLAAGVWGERMGARRCSLQDTLNTLFPPGTRWPASSRNSFPRDSSCGSRSCSLKKDTSLFSLFLVFPVLTF